jgi:hypothetical protein
MERLVAPSCLKINSWRRKKRKSSGLQNKKLSANLLETARQLARSPLIACANKSVAVVEFGLFRRYSHARGRPPKQGMRRGKKKVFFNYLSLCYTRSTALMHPSFSGSFVTYMRIRAKHPFSETTGRKRDKTTYLGVLSPNNLTSLCDETQV